MNVDERLAESVRSVLADAGAVREVKMFGGIGFLLNGNLLAGASRRGLLVRVGKDQQRAALKRPGARPMVMRDRVMEGYIYVDATALTAGAVPTWIDLALAFVHTLPAKATAKRKSPKSAKVAKVAKAGTPSSGAKQSKTSNASKAQKSSKASKAPRTRPGRAKAKKR